MYLPPHFSQPDHAVLHELMRQFPLASLVRLTPAGLTADPIPLLLIPDSGPLGTLRGHVARANPLWRELAPDDEVLAIFHGPQAYITPTWYPGKAEHGKVVPTWNYAVAHAHGRLRIVEDRAWLRELLATLTDSHERTRPQPWRIDDAPADYIDKMLAAVVGIELTITRLVGKTKASQNQSAGNRAGVGNGLRGQGDEAMAALVESAERSGKA